MILAVLLLTNRSIGKGINRIDADTTVAVIYGYSFIAASLYRFNVNTACIGGKL